MIYLSEFQSTLPRGERRTGLTIILRYDAISIHAPARGATKNNQWIWSRFCISIHAPARGATKSKEQKKKRRKFQSTLPRGERLSTYFSPSRFHEISIHAPARGATYWRLNVRPNANISIHAPARGATLGAGRTEFPEDDFNPRSREGSDLLFL